MKRLSPPSLAPQRGRATRGRRQAATASWCLGLGAGVAALAACGPSVQAVYEGSIRFEHCYRLDLDAHIVPSHRQACWQEWLQKYTYGQRRDHLEYARQRIEALAAGDTATQTLNVGSHEPVEREFYVTVPSPVSAYVAPPPVVPTATPATPPPGRECTLECEKQWQGCDRSCTENAAAATPARAPQSPGSSQGVSHEQNVACSCATDYRACVQRCMDTPAVAPAAARSPK